MTMALIGGRELPVIYARHRLCDGSWQNREAMWLELETDAQTAAELFVDGAAWSVRYDEEPPRTVDLSEFSKAGEITDRRDGTILVKMGIPTDGERLAALDGAYKRGVETA